MSNQTEDTTSGVSQEEKRLRDAQYRVNVREFGKILENFTLLFGHVLVLDRAMSTVPRGKFLQFAVPTPDQKQILVNFTRDDMRYVLRKYTRELLALKNYLRVSKKKFKAPVKPESFSAIYIPVYAGPALKAFINYVYREGERRGQPVNFGPASYNPDDFPGQQIPPLLDHLPLAKLGYFLRNTTTLLFHMFGRINGLQIRGNAQYIRADEALRNTFGAMPPANINKKSKLFNPSEPIPSNLTTFSMLAKDYPPGSKDKRGNDMDFNPDRFASYFYQNIAASNYFSLLELQRGVRLPSGDEGARLGEELQVALNNLQNDQSFREQLLKEHQIVDTVNEQWKIINEPTKRENQKQRKKEKAAQAKREEQARTQGQLQQQSNLPGAVLGQLPIFAPNNPGQGLAAVPTFVQATQ